MNSYFSICVNCFEEATLKLLTGMDKLVLVGTFLTFVIAFGSFFYG